MPRKVVPVAVERRRERHDPAAPDASLDHRRGAVVEPGQHAVVWRRRERAVPEEPHVGEVAVARVLERLEDRMAVVEIPERAAARTGAIDRRRRACRAGAASSPLTGVRSPSTMNRPPPCSTNSLSSVGRRRRQRGASFSTTSDRPSRLAGVDARQRHHLDLERRRPARRRAPSSGRSSDSRGAPSALDHQHRHGPARRQHEVEVVVVRQRVRAGADRRRACSPRPPSTRSNVTAPDAFGPMVDLARGDRASVDFEPHRLIRHRVRRRGWSAPAVIVTRSSLENVVALERRPTTPTDSAVSRSATDTGVNVAPSGNWISSCRSHPRPLEVADQHGFLPAQRRIG